MIAGRFGTEWPFCTPAHARARVVVLLIGYARMVAEVRRQCEDLLESLRVLKRVRGWVVEHNEACGCFICDTFLHEQIPFLQLAHARALSLVLSLAFSLCQTTLYSLCHVPRASTCSLHMHIDKCPCVCLLCFLCCAVPCFERTACLHYSLTHVH